MAEMKRVEPCRNQLTVTAGLRSTGLCLLTKHGTPARVPAVEL
jgi:hypothetical protein